MTFRLVHRPLLFIISYSIQCLSMPVPADIVESSIEVSSTLFIHMNITLNCWWDQQLSLILTMWGNSKSCCLIAAKLTLAHVYARFDKEIRGISVLLKKSLFIHQY